MHIKSRKQVFLHCLLFSFDSFELKVIAIESNEYENKNCHGNLLNNTQVFTMDSLLP